jgi:hypothetical protein
MAATLMLKAGKALNASMSTFSATLAVVLIKGGNAKTLDASMSTFDATLTRQTGKMFAASMSTFSATLAIAVTHGTVPPTCIPAACTEIATIISHVEQCENPGS